MSACVQTGQMPVWCRRTGRKKRGITMSHQSDIFSNKKKIASLIAEFIEGNGADCSSVATGTVRRLSNFLKRLCWKKALGKYELASCLSNQSCIRKQAAFWNKWTLCLTTQSVSLSKWWWWWQFLFLEMTGMFLRVSVHAVFSRWRRGR